MTSYLQSGWFAKTGPKRLRTEVVDGAMDVAGMMLRAGVPARRILRVALTVRSLVVIADPLMRGGSRFGARNRDVIAHRVESLTDGFPELQGFVNDCLENITNASEMTAFYLHLVHVTRMMQLLSHAVDGVLTGLATGKTPAKKKPTKKATQKRPKKKPTKRTTKPATKNPAKKPTKKNTARPAKRVTQKSKKSR